MCQPNFLFKKHNGNDVVITRQTRNGPNKFFCKPNSAQAFVDIQGHRQLLCPISAVWSRDKLYTWLTMGQNSILLILRLFLLIIVVVMLMVQVKSIRVFRFELIVSEGLMITYIIAHAGLAVSASIDTCKAFIFQVCLCFCIFTWRILKKWMFYVGLLRWLKGPCGISFEKYYY